MNAKDLATSCIHRMKEFGIDSVVLCSGARNAPLAQALFAENYFKVYDFFHENSAGFFALGLAKQGKKVAVMSTSGTAVAQFLSPCMEAYYDSQFILFITADRPKRYRNSGAPQAVEQSSILKDFTYSVVDTESTKDLEKLKLSASAPSHWNLCFDEPLQWKESKLGPVPSGEARWEEGQRESRNFDTPALEGANSNNTVFLISRLTKNERNELKSFFEGKSVAVYLEASSGLTEKDFVGSSCFFLKTDQELLSYLQNHSVDNIIHFGGVPLTRLWRNLANDLQLNVYSRGKGGFSGIPGVSRDTRCLDVLSLKHDLAGFADSVEIKIDPEWKKQKEKAAKFLLNAGGNFPDSEFSIYSQLNQYLTPSSFVYLGNSMPIRYFEFIKDTQLACFSANRGANGIDGQLASFLGEVVASEFSQNLAVFGDLTFLYDQASLWALKFLADKNIKIIVINNNGGRIFDRVFSENPFQNSHNIRMKDLANMYGLNYSNDIKSLDSNQSYMIELFPEDLDTSNFWKQWNLLWKS